MPDFSEAKKGDRVWSSAMGWGYVVRIRPHEDLEVLFERCGLMVGYRLDGKVGRYDEFPTLFWDSFPIPDPPRPKRKSPSCWGDV